MKPYNKYDPEDIESLLLHKQFHELYPEEKEFILQHIETPEEYESLRKTLFELRDAAQEDQWLEPDAKLKRDLMAQFVSEEKGGFRVWLNSLFTWPDVQWYRQPAFKMAFATVCIVAAIVVFIDINKQQTKQFADNKTNVPTEKKADTEQKAKAENLDETKNLFAENIPQKELPPAPPASVVTAADAMVVVEEVQDAEYEDVAVSADEVQPPPANTSHKDAIGGKELADHKAIEKEELISESKKSLDKTNAAVTYSNQTNSSATSTKIVMPTNVGSSNLASAKSKSIAEVNDLLNHLYTAQ